MFSAETIKTLLFDDIREMASHPELFAKNPLRDFTRKRKFDVKDVLLFPILMQRDSMNQELLKYFDRDINTPSFSAYSQQRSKLLPDTYRQILFNFNRHFLPTLYHQKYILTSVDGSGFNIFRNPSDLDTYNPPTGRSALGFNEIHVVASYLLSDRIYTDAVIQPSRKKNEYSAICALVDSCRTDQGIPLFLADRGFPSFNLFAHAKEKGVGFLVRAKALYAQRLLGPDMPTGQEEFDVTIDRIVTRSFSKKKRSHPDQPALYRVVDKKTAFDYMEPGASEEYHLRLRVVKVKLKKGLYEYLVTNLTEEEFPKEELRTLYHIRWGMETSFRELKHAVGAVDFHCRTVENVSHEIWARLLLYNFCSQITLLAVVVQKNTKYIYQVNYTMAIKNCHAFLRRQASRSTINIVGLIEKYLLPIRPGRNFPRQHRFQPPMKFTYRH